MRKTIIFILSVIFLGIANMACDNQKTLQEYIREEKKAVERYIDNQGIIVLNEYPKDKVFKEKEYFKTSDGLYIHVVDSGNGRRVVPLVDEVLVRFEYYVYIKQYVSGNDSSSIVKGYSVPIEFIYGQTGSYNSDPSGLACNGWAIPLSYVGEGAIVDLIIPSQLGGALHNSTYGTVVLEPVFYKNLKYTKFY
jgi:hypothetical protein